MFPQVIYINLDHRTDRRQEIEAELKRVGVPEDKILRWPATLHARGAIGCSMSHVAVLKYITTLPLEVENVIILEDDFNFVEDVAMVRKSIEEFLSRPNDKWDLVLLSYRLYKKENYDDLVSLALGAWTTAGFMVNRKGALKLLENFEESLDGFTRTGDDKYLLDGYWNKFIENRRCFYFNKALGYQRYSYSDIAGCHTDRPSDLG
jgi:glycosyl transferase family 25